ARRDENPPTLLGAAFGRALCGDLLPAGGVNLGSACLAHARFVQPLRQPAGGLAARLLVPSLRRRAGVVRRPGYRALCEALHHSGAPALGDPPPPPRNSHSS